jgi:hypothetical protein
MKYFYMPITQSEQNHSIPNWVLIKLGGISLNLINFQHSLGILTSHELYPFN